MAADQFRTVVGVIQFEPREGAASGKAVRNIVVRQTGFKDQSIKVSATLWPSHEHVAVEEGDFVVLEGKFSQNKGTDKDGNPRTYNNLSVVAIAVIGKLDSGTKPETENAVDEEPTQTDDDIPF